VNDQSTFGHIGSGFESNNYPHPRTDADVEAAKAETASALARGELTLPPVVREIGVVAVEGKAEVIPVNIVADEVEKALSI